MARKPIPSFTYVLCVVPRAGRYLVVQERKHHQAWYLPAGGVERGESLFDAARRETLKEAGVFVRPRGILGCDHTWVPTRRGELAVKWRFFLLATPEDERAPKSTPDRHTLAARWLTPSEISTLPLRSGEVLRWVEHVDAGRLVMPLEAFESMPALQFLD